MTAGPHAVRAFTTVVGPEGWVTDWQAACGRSGRVYGTGVFRRAGPGQRLCGRCFPAGHTGHPEPVEVFMTEPADPECGQLRFLDALVKGEQ